MRVITSLFVAGVLGTSAVGALNHYLGSDEPKKPDSRQVLRTLLREDRPAALRLFEKATFTCLPELDKLKSNSARKFFPRMIGITLDMADKSGKTLSEADKQAINNEIRQIIQVIPESDGMVFVEAVNQLKANKAKVDNCMYETFADFARNAQAKKKKPLLSDVELRGS